jgi:hypothetical protein
MKISIESAWQRQASELRAEAAKYPQGRYQDALLERARQLETAARAEQWAGSSGLRPPSGSDAAKVFS